MFIPFFRTFFAKVAGQELMLILNRKNLASYLHRCQRRIRNIVTSNKKVTMNYLTNDKLVIVGAAGMIGSNMTQTALMLGLTLTSASTTYFLLRV